MNMTTTADILHTAADLLEQGVWCQGPGELGPEALESDIGTCLLGDIYLSCMLHGLYEWSEIAEVMDRGDVDHDAFMYVNGGWNYDHLEFRFDPRHTEAVAITAKVIRDQHGDEYSDRVDHEVCCEFNDHVAEDKQDVVDVLRKAAANA